MSHNHTYNSVNRRRELCASLTPAARLIFFFFSEWDEVPSDDEDKALKEDESKYVCVYEISCQPSRIKARNDQILVSHI